MEPSLVVAGPVELVAHALVLPTADAHERQRHDAQVEEIAMRVAQAHEEAAGATATDVSRPDLARRAGLGDWPGFDLLSVTPAGDRRAIEVKGRARAGGIELSENEWAKACNLRAGYWLYAVYDCATPRPRLVRVRDPFGKLLVRSPGAVGLFDPDIVGARGGGGGVREVHNSGSGGGPNSVRRAGPFHPRGC